MSCPWVMKREELVLPLTYYCTWESRACMLLGSIVNERVKPWMWVSCLKGILVGELALPLACCVMALTRKSSAPLPFALTIISRWESWPCHSPEQQ